MEDTQKNLPRDTFLYLLSIATLIASAVSLGVLLFQYVNIYYPDVLQNYYISADSYKEPIRFALAGLVVLFPVFFWASRAIRKDIINFPEKRDLRLRKWLLYLTVFIAALVIIGDLVALINNYLQGDLTIRFLLKVASILFIAGSIFYYYYTQLREASSEGSYRMSLFPKLVSVIVAAAVIFGFYVAGSPQSQRSVRFDERRVSDLQSIQGQLVSYWQSKRALPPVLSALEDSISGYRAPQDPKTGKDYEYRKDGDLKFTLCADFGTDTSKSKNNPTYYPPDDIYGPQNWLHSTGQQCFSRTIDPQRYPPLNPKPLY